MRRLTETYTGTWCGNEDVLVGWGVLHCCKESSGNEWRRSGGLKSSCGELEQHGGESGVDKEVELEEGVLGIAE